MKKRSVNVTQITTVDSIGAPTRQLPCGCWQTLIKGDIITASVEQWVTTIACDEHGAA